jgi:hypothetical protein
MRVPESLTRELLFRTDSPRSPREPAAADKTPRMAPAGREGSREELKTPGIKRTAPIPARRDAIKPPTKPATLLLGLAGMIPRFPAPKSIPAAQAAESPAITTIRKITITISAWGSRAIRINQMIKKPGYIITAKPAAARPVKSRKDSSGAKTREIKSQKAPRVRAARIVPSGRPKFTVRVMARGHRAPRRAASTEGMGMFFFLNRSENSTAPRALKRVARILTIRWFFWGRKTTIKISRGTPIKNMSSRCTVVFIF